MPKNKRAFENLAKETEKLTKDFYLQNSFPAHAFDSSIQDVINGTSGAMNFPKAYTGCAVLAAASHAIGNTFHIRVKGSWTESSCVYMMLVGPPGANKTAPIKYALSPIQNRDKKLFSEYKKEKTKYDSLFESWKQSKHGEKPVEPEFCKNIVNDFTIEALMKLHDTNQRGILVYSDELAGWLNRMDRYNKGGEVETYLSNWSGGAIAIDRRSHTPLYISKPFISIVGGIQKGVLARVLSGVRSENGLLDRILPAVPDTFKKQYWPFVSMDETLTEYYNDIIETMLDWKQNCDQDRVPNPTVLEYDELAKDVLINWQKMNTDRANQTHDETRQGVYSKMEIYVSRLALILECISAASKRQKPLSISENSINGAIALTEYFIICSFKVRDLIASPADRLPDDKRALYEALPEQFSLQEGLEIALDGAIPERTFKRFVADSKLFSHPKRGFYSKTY